MIRWSWTEVSVLGSQVIWQAARATLDVASLGALMVQNHQNIIHFLSTPSTFHIFAWKHKLKFCFASMLIRYYLHHTSLVTYIIYIVTIFTASALRLIQSSSYICVYVILHVCIYVPSLYLCVWGILLMQFFLWSFSVSRSVFWSKILNKSNCLKYQNSQECEEEKDCQSSIKKSNMSKMLKRSKNSNYHKF